MRRIFLIIITLGLLVLSVYCKKTLASQEINSDTVIEISLEGGHVYGGINPLVQNKRIIKNNGEIIIIRKNLYDEKLKTPTEGTRLFFIPRDKVEDLARFILDNKFFALENIYDCKPFNKECQNRKKRYPPPVPLKINIKIGNLNKEVIVTVYKKEMIDYPDNLEVIVKKIEEIISQAQKQE